MREPMTPALERALAAVKEAEAKAAPYAVCWNGMGSRQLGKILWPDSPGWRRYSNCGVNGAMCGKGPTIAAARLLNRLVKLGHLRVRDRRYFPI